MTMLIYSPDIYAQKVWLTIDPGEHGDEFDFVTGLWDTKVNGIYKISHSDTALMRRNLALGKLDSTIKKIQFEASSTRYQITSGSGVGGSIFFRVNINGTITDIAPRASAVLIGAKRDTLRLNANPVMIVPVRYPEPHLLYRPVHQQLGALDPRRNRKPGQRLLFVTGYFG